MQILSWKFQLAASGIEFASDPTKLSAVHEFFCTKCESIWSSTLKRQLAYGQCPSCSKYYTYLLYFPSLDLYKIGYSTSIPLRQIAFGIKSTKVLVIEHETEELARALERKWLSNVKHLKVDTGKLRAGNKETFKFIVPTDEVLEPAPYSKDIFPEKPSKKEPTKSFSWIK